MEIQFTTRVFKEGHTYVAHALELDVSSCGRTKEKAVKNRKEAVRLFLVEAAKIGAANAFLAAGLPSEVAATYGISLTSSL